MKYVRTVVSTQSGGEPPFLTSEMFDVVRNLTIERPSSENSISQLKQLAVRKAGLPPLLVYFLTSSLAAGLRLNILSMRSVITNPPTTLVVEQNTAMKPRIVLTVL